jgi:hypothetical protein
MRHFHIIIANIFAREAVIYEESTYSGGNNGVRSMAGMGRFIRTFKSIKVWNIIYGFE